MENKKTHIEMANCRRAQAGLRSSPSHRASQTRDWGRRHARNGLVRAAGQGYSGSRCSLRPTVGAAPLGGHPGGHRLPICTSRHNHTGVAALVIPRGASHARHSCSLLTLSQSSAPPRHPVPQRKHRVGEAAVGRDWEQPRRGSTLASTGRRASLRGASRASPLGWEPDLVLCSCAHRLELKHDNEASTSTARKKDRRNQTRKRKTHP